MAILEHIPKQETIRACLQTIQSTAIATDDGDRGAVRTLWDSAQALWELVRELEELRTKALVGVYARGCSHYQQMALPEELGSLKMSMADPNRPKAERDELSETIQALCAAYDKNRMDFENELIPTVSLMRKKCLSLAESDLADRVITVFHHKAEEMQREYTWAQESLRPLVLDFQSQLASVDKAISDIASKNFFDRLLELMPSQGTVGELALPVSKGMPRSDGVTQIPTPKTATQDQPRPDTPTTPAPPATPEQAAQRAQTAEQTERVVQETQTKALPRMVTVEVGKQTPKPALDTASYEGSARSGGSDAAEPPAPMTADSLSTATPEAVALKAAYEVIQSGLKLFSTGTNLYKLITAHQKLREQLDRVQTLYEAAMNRHYAIKRELDHLERVRVVLNSVAAYQCEVGACVTTLEAYTDAFKAAGAKPAVYFEIFRLLMDYLERLELIWR